MATPRGGVPDARSSEGVEPAAAVLPIHGLLGLNHDAEPAEIRFSEAARCEEFTHPLRSRRPGPKSLRICVGSRAKPDTEPGLIGERRDDLHPDDSVIMERVRDRRSRVFEHLPAVVRHDKRLARHRVAARRSARPHIGMSGNPLGLAVSPKRWSAGREPVDSWWRRARLTERCRSGESPGVV